MVSPRLLGFVVAVLLIAAVSTGVTERAAAEVTPAQQAAMLTAHNTLRRSVAVAESLRLGQTVLIPDLTWNSQLAAVAQAWADTLLTSAAFEYNPESVNFGENIAIEVDKDPASSGDRAFAGWAAQAAAYDWEANSCSDACEDYLQIVWAGTTAVGCGMATDGITTIWVCDYTPPGLDDGRPYAPATSVLTAALPSSSSTPPVGTPTAAVGTPAVRAGTVPPTPTFSAPQFPPFIYTVRNFSNAEVRVTVTWPSTPTPTRSVKQIPPGGSGEIEVVQHARSLEITIEMFGAVCRFGRACFPEWGVIHTQKLDRAGFLCLRVDGTKDAPSVGNCLRVR